MGESTLRVKKQTKTKNADQWHNSLKNSSTKITTEKKITNNNSHNLNVQKKMKIKNSKTVVHEKKAANDLLDKIRHNTGQFDMLETSKIVAKLHNDFAIKAKDFQEKFGIEISSPHVYNMLKLANLPPKVEALIKAGKIKPSTVVHKVRKRQKPEVLLALVENEIQKMEIEAEKEARRLEKENNNQKKTEILQTNLAKTLQKYLGGKNVSSRKLNEIVGIVQQSLA